ncbi:MAG: hypothetical protein ACRDIV_18570 [Ktedonobacteraceae bacterium]
MPENIKILSSRRAYEFRPDDLRLTTLSVKPVQEQIQQFFQFQSSALGTPMQTFGEVPVTYPPGFVFNMGVFLSEEKQIVPIRFLHFEPSRIVIDVAGPSTAIDSIAERLFQLFEGLQAADGTPVFGEPVRIFNYSEITAQFSVSLSKLFASHVSELFTKMLNRGKDNEQLIIVPSLMLQAFAHDEQYEVALDPHSFSLTLRAGTNVEEHVYYSIAPLDSEEHLSYLRALEEALTA